MGCSINHDFLCLLILIRRIKGEVDLVFLVINVCSFKYEREHRTKVRIKVCSEERALLSLLVHVLKDYARASYNRRNYDSFRTVDDESTTICHNREFAEEDFLLLNFAVTFLESDLNLYRNTECRALSLTLCFGLHCIDIIRIYTISSILNFHLMIGRLDWEVCPKKVFESQFFVRLLPVHDFVKLQKILVRGCLYLHKIWNRVLVEYFGSNVDSLKFFTVSGHIVVPP